MSLTSYLCTVLWCMQMNSACKGKESRYRPGVGQRVGRSIPLFFHDRGTRRGWVVSSTPRPLFTLSKDTVPILQEAGWAPEPVWAGGKSRPHRDSIPDSPACSQSLYWPSYRVHKWNLYILAKCSELKNKLNLHTKKTKNVTLNYPPFYVFLPY